MVRVNPTSEQVEALYLQNAAYEAQRDATEQIRVQQKRVNEARSDADAAIQNIKDEFQRQSIHEKDVSEANLAQQKLKGYEAVRDTRREIAKEAENARRLGEKQVAEASFQTERALQQNEIDSKKKMQAIRQSVQKEAEFNTKSAQQQIDMEKKTHTLRLQEMQDQNQASFDEIKNRGDKEYGRLKTNYNLASEQTLKDFENRYQGQVESYNQSLNTLNELAGSRIEQIRSDSARKLAAYNERQNDPFYKLVKANSQFFETEGAYKIVTKIPPHERENVSVKVSGGEISLHGVRRNSEKLEVEPGHFQETHSYQTYSEKFPIQSQVDARSITKEFKGNTLIVTIPKRGALTQSEPYQAKKPEKAHVQTPIFPDNLPLEEKLKPIHEEAAKQPSKPPGSGTLV